MSLRSAFLSVGLCLLVASWAPVLAAHAAEPVKLPTVHSDPADAPPDDDKVVVCKKQKSVGSHMVKQHCRTKAEIRHDREVAREVVGKGIKSGKALGPDE